MSDPFAQHFGPLVEAYTAAHGPVSVTPTAVRSSIGVIGQPTVRVPAFVHHRRRLVRDTHGREVISEATIRCHLGYEADFQPGYDLTLPSSPRASVVISVIAHDDAGAFGAPSHLEVLCS